MRKLMLAFVSLFALGLAACNQAGGDSAEQAKAPQQVPAPAPVAPAVPKCLDCGTVAAIDKLKQEGKGTGMGAVAGAIAGGLLGHQFGGGKGKIATTVIGAAGGAYGGNVAEKKIRSTRFYRVTVRMEDGNTRTVDVNELNGVTVGTRVKVVGDNLQIITG